MPKYHNSMEKKLFSKSRKNPNPIAIGIGIYKFIQNIKEKKRKEEEWIEKENLRREKEQFRLRKKIEKEEKLEYTNERIEEVRTFNETLTSRLLDIENLLLNSLKKKYNFDLYKPIDNSKFMEFVIHPNLLASDKIPVREAYIDRVSKPWFFTELLNIRYLINRYRRKLEDAERQFQNDLKSFNFSERQKLERLEKLKNTYSSKKEQFEKERDKKNAEINVFIQLLQKGEKDSVIKYFSDVLSKSVYPEKIEFKYELDFNSKKNELAIEIIMPSIEIIPAILEYRYIKSKDEIVEKLRKYQNLLELYAFLLSSINLRVIHEIYSADQFRLINEIRILNKCLTLDRATGKNRLLKVLDFKLNFERYHSLDLENVHPISTIERFHGMFYFDEL